VTAYPSEEDLKSYEEKGCWISPKIFSDELIAELRSEYDRIYSGDHDFDCYPWLGPREFDMQDASVKQFNNGWWINKSVRGAVAHPEIGRIAAALMQTEEVRIWHDQVLLKPGVKDYEGEDGIQNNVGWHQDYAHWQVSNNQNMCTAWVALQDTDASNGAFRIVAGSNQWGLNKDAHTYGEKDLDVLKKQYAPDDREWVEEPVELKAGQASFHNALTFHGSGPNLSSEPRLSLIVHMMPKGCGLQKHSNWHPCATLLGPDAKEGQPFEGEFFPRIWP
jgi:ectoine hydroxylase-related dioxygenase (phytanoyl-CoA dioxygenase family)